MRLKVLSVTCFLVLATLVIAKSVQQILEDNIAKSNDICEELEAAANASNNFAKDVDCANSELQGLLNAVNAELLEIQQRINQSQSQQEILILTEKKRIMQDVSAQVGAAVAADNALIGQLDALTTQLSEAKSQTVAFGNSMRTMTGGTPIPDFTPPTRTPKEIPTFTTPGGIDLPTFVEENQDLLDLLREAVDDGEVPAPGEMPDKFDAILAGQGSVAATQKDVAKILKDLKQEVKNLDKPKYDGDPQIAEKIHQLNLLIDEVDDVDTSAAQAAVDLDKDALLETRDVLDAAAADMEIVRAAAD